MSTPGISIIKGMTVVIADDDDVTRGLLRGLLRSIGMQVLDEARDGVQALSSFQKHKPEILCLDIDMPELDGIAVLGKVRELNNDVIVLMISAATTAGNVQQVMGARADGFIAKPFSTAKITREVERAVARRNPPMG